MRIAPFNSGSELRKFSKRRIEERRKQAEMLLVALDFNMPETLPQVGYCDALLSLTSRRDSEADRMIRSTYFGMWLETLGRWHQCGGAQDAILPPPLDLHALSTLSARTTLREEDVPPFMRLLIPPSHEFRRNYDAAHRVRAGSHDWESALEAAILNSDLMMPGMKQVVEAFVSHFLILEDVEFRSCSADRYLGLIILSTSDQSLIDIEESVVHEVGHQILYHLDRHNALFHTHDDPNEVVLPWSGSIRNFFGFFHACYIYLILRDYYRGAAQHHPFDREYCSQRLDEIQSGLEKAISPLSDGDDLLTEAGRELCKAMIHGITAKSVEPVPAPADPRGPAGFVQSGISTD